MPGRGVRPLAGGIALLLALAGVALLVHRDRSTTNLAISPSRSRTTTAAADLPELFTGPPTSTTTAPLSAAPTSVVAAAVPTTAVRPTPTSQARPVSTPATSSPVTTVPVGPPITTRPGLDAHYTWIEGTGCVVEDPGVRLELFDMAGQPLGGDGAYVEPDGSWSWPIGPPSGKATVVATCINVPTQAVHMTYPPLVVDFP
ncbi:MAG: hypothetical protein QOG87_2108 [Actinomycetota bacterium]|jgi:hypothetical protein